MSRPVWRKYVLNKAADLEEISALILQSSHITHQARTSSPNSPPSINFRLQIVFAHSASNTNMFSFPRPDVVQTGTPGYAYLYDAASGKSYIHLKTVGDGNQSAVKLVANTDTGEHVIQKIDGVWLLPPNPLIDPRDLGNKPANREIRILAYLNSLIHNPTTPIAPLTPRWTTCISHDGRERAISYWKLCNGGL
jgi:hypothetical protein